MEPINPVCFRKSRRPVDFVFISLCPSNQGCQSGMWWSVKSRAVDPLLLPDLAHPAVRFAVQSTHRHAQACGVFITGTNQSPNGCEWAGMPSVKMSLARPQPPGPQHKQYRYFGQVGAL